MLWQTLVPRNFDVGTANIIEGLRAALACAVLVSASEALHYPDLCWAAIAAFWICLADPGGSIRGRFAALATLAILGTLSCAVAIWATALSIWVAIFLAFVWSFAGSLARIYGEAAGRVGQFVLVTFLVSIGNFGGRSIDPMVAALLYLAGASWALILTLILWRIHPYGPARRALALVYDELAGFAAGLAQLRRETKIEGDPFGAMARDHRRRIREALDSARTTIANIGRTHVGRSRRTDQQLALLECADQIFAALIALSDLLETGRGRPTVPPLDASLVDGLDRIPTLLEMLSAATLAGDRSLACPLDAELGDLGRSVSEVGSAEDQIVADHPPSFHLYRHLIDTIFRYMSDAADAAAGATQRESLDALSKSFSPKRSSLREALFMPLAENLSFDSVPLQHALRLAVAASIALLITFWFELAHGYWLTMTTVLILQPYAATTWQLSMKRIAASVLGGVLAAALGIVFHTSWGITLVIFPITIATMVFRTVDYGLYVLFLTPQFVLISALAEPGTGDLSLSWLRAVNSALGGFLALAAGMLMWPGRELQRLPADIAKSLGANHDYLLLVLDARIECTQSALVDACRRLAGLASNNAEASVQRLLSEPGNDAVILEAAMTIVTSVRRLTSAITVIWLLPRQPTTPPVMPEFGLLNEWIIDALRTMANAASRNAAPATLKERPEFPQTAMAHADHHSHPLFAEAIARICDQIEIIHAALTRLVALQTAEPSHALQPSVEPPSNSQ